MVWGLKKNIMIRNTKQRNLRDKKNNKKHQWPVSLHQYYSCANSCVPTPTPLLEGFICDRCGSSHLDYKINYPLREFVEEEEKMSEQKTSFKGGGDVRDGNGANMFAYIFNWCNTNLSPLSTYASLLLTTAG